MRRTGLVGVTAIVLGLAVCGAGPAREGTDVEGTAGFGWFEQERADCNGPTYLYRTQHVGGQARIRHRFQGSGGLLGGGVGATYMDDVDDRLVDPGDVAPGEDPDPPEYQSHAIVAGTLRGGWQWSWFGGELGFIWGGDTAQDLGPPLPSVVVWVVPVDDLHFFLSIFEDPALYLRGAGRLGFGYDLDRWSFGLSIGGLFNQGGVGTGEVELRVADATYVRVGLSLQTQGKLGPEGLLFAGMRYAF